MALMIIGASVSGNMVAAMHVPIFAIGFWRNLATAAILLPFVLIRDRRALFALSAKDIRTIVLAAISLALAFALWLPALRMTSVAAATALVCSEAGWVVLIRKVTGDHIGRWTIVGLILCLVGTLVVTGVDVTVSGRALAGDLLALGAGLAAAVSLVTCWRVRQVTTTAVFGAICYGACSLILLFLCAISGQAAYGYRIGDWWRLAVLTLVAQMMGQLIPVYMLAKISPTVISLAGLLSVPGSAALAAFFLHQALQPEVVVGLVLIIGGLVLVIMRGSSSAPDQAHSARNLPVRASGERRLLKHRAQTVMRRCTRCVRMRRGRSIAVTRTATTGTRPWTWLSAAPGQPSSARWSTSPLNLTAVHLQCAEWPDVSAGPEVGWASYARLHQRRHHILYELAINSHTQIR